METTNKKVNIDVDTISVLYRQYRAYFLPLGIILACFLIFFFIVIPQTQQYLVNAEALKAEEQKLEILKNNDNFLTNLDEAKTEGQLKILSAVLPSDKDFAGVMNAISYNASQTNVSVGDFEFIVGSLSAPEKTISPSSPLNIKVSVKGSTASVINFINLMYKTAPIGAINTVKLNGENVSLEMVFYYTAFPKQGISDEQPILPLSSQSEALLTQLSSWNNLVPQTILPFIPNISPDAAPGTSSFSGTTNPEPF